MGLQKNTSDATFVKIVKGVGLVVRVKEGTEGAEVRKNQKTGEEIHELVFDELSGYVKEIKTKNLEYNGKTLKFWSVRMEEAGDTFIFSMPYSSRYSTSFLKRLPNVDFSAKLEIKTAFFDDDDKQVLWLTQEGVKVEQAFSKEEPNGLPEMKQVEVKGEMVWDDTEMMNYLEGMVEEKIQPKLAELNKVDGIEPDMEEDVKEAPQAKKTTSGTSTPKTQEASQDMDDLPF